MSTWLNWASIGRKANTSWADDTTTPLRPEEAALALREALKLTIRWAAEWTRCQVDDVFLTSGTTEALDVALRVPWNRLPHVVFHTQYAHRSVVESAQRAAAYISAVTGDQTSVRELRLQGTSAVSVCNALTAATADLHDAEPILVLEHVASSEGIRFPVEEIDAAVHERHPNVRLIIDGAQAVGIWAPTRSLNCAYLGCFHKYCDGPAGSGFAALPAQSPEPLPQHVAALSAWGLGMGGECLPTVDYLKWCHCWLALSEFPSSEARARRHRVEVLRGAFGALDVPMGDSDLPSHILPIDLGSAPSAQLAWDHFHDEGFVAKCDGRRLRVALHHTITDAEIHDAVRALTQIASRAS